MPLDPKGQANRLEAEVDSTNLPDVLARLATVCYEKAAHLRENWQDENAARVWERAAKKLDAVVAKLHADFLA